MIELEQKLISKLQGKRVQIDITRGNAIMFRKVPTNRRFFSKSFTNLLIKKEHRGQLVLIFVDRDLRYSGKDKRLIRAFASGYEQDGWRVLWFCPAKGNDFGSIVEIALVALGFDGQEPILPAMSAITHKSGGDKLLAAFGVNLTIQAAKGKGTVTIGREEEINQVTSAVLRWGQPRLTLIVGESGVGKTNLLQAVAGRLSLHQHSFNLVAIHLADLLFGQQCSAFLMDLLDEESIPSETVVALEHIELAFSTPHSVLLMTQILDKGGKLIGTTLPQYLPVFQTSPLARRVQVVELSELSSSQSKVVLRSLRDQIVSHYGLEIDDSCVHTCVKAAEDLAGFFPAKAIALLDAAVAGAALLGSKVVGPDDIYFTAQKFITGGD